MLTILCCAKKKSKRLPGKNTKLLNGIPLIEYTFKQMKYLEEHIECELLLVTDSEECEEIADKYNINSLLERKIIDGIDFNRWIHKNIKSSEYVILQPTNPLRDIKKIIEWIHICKMVGIKSAYSAVKIDRLNNRMDGNFFYYQSFQLLEDDLIDENSIVFLENIFCDIDTIEDFEKAEEILCEQK